MLPLDDSNNPLYNQSKAAQCRVLINWQTSKLTPIKLFSLKASYTAKEVKKAYHQLAQHVHPDKNPDIDTAAAFSVINSAYEYLLFRLKSEQEQQIDSSIKLNPFYQADQENTGFNQSPHSNDFETAYYHDGYGNFYPRYTSAHDPKVPDKKPYQEMTFYELVNEIKEFPLSKSIEERLKWFILKDKSLLSVGINTEIPPIRLLHRIAQVGDIPFIQWLIDQGADPFFIADEPVYDAASYAAGFRRIDVLQYFQKKYGREFYYVKNKETNELVPQWWRLYELIRFGNSEIARFLLQDMGYLKYTDGQDFEKHWKKAYRATWADITTLLIEFKLLNNFKDCFYFALEKGYFDVVDKLLEVKPEFDYANLFWIYLKHNHYSKPTNLDWIIKFIESNTFTKNNLSSIIYYCTEKLRYLLASHHYYEYVSFSNDVFVLTNKLIQSQPNLSLLVQDMLTKLPTTDTESITRNMNSLYKIVNKALIRKSLSIPDAPIFPLDRGDINSRILKFDDLDQKILIQTTTDLIANCSTYLMHRSNVHDVSKNCPGRSYYSYTPLHISCEFNLNELAFLIIDRMNQLKLSLNRYCKKEILSPDGVNYTNFKLNTYITYLHTPLHLAIINNNRKLAIKLIQSGANLTDNYVEKLPETPTSSFWRITQKTPLQMAVEMNQTDVIEAMQLAMLDNYIMQREKEGEYTSNLALCAHTLFGSGFGYNKETKLKEARAFRALLVSPEQNSDLIAKSRHGALSQGRLGKITQLSKYIHQEGYSSFRP